MHNTEYRRKREKLEEYNPKQGKIPLANRIVTFMLVIRALIFTFLIARLLIELFRYGDFYGVSIFLLILFAPPAYFDILCVRKLRKNLKVSINLQNFISVYSLIGLWFVFDYYFNIKLFLIPCIYNLAVIIIILFVKSPYPIYSAKLAEPVFVNPNQDDENNEPENKEK